MKLLRVGLPGKEVPAVFDRALGIRSLAGEIDDIDGSVLGASSLRKLRDLDVAALPSILHDVRIGPCVANCRTVIGVGLNYHEHAHEIAAVAPKEPILFMKATSSISGPNDDIVIPPGATKVDWEVELGVVLGEYLQRATDAAAEQAIAGYCVINDVSERSFQLEGTGQWMKGKSADCFGPIGPWLVTRDEISKPEALDLWLDVNGIRMQEACTRQMILSPSRLVSYVSQFMSLQPGDIIATGTPGGTGMAQNPPRYLVPGDRVSLGVAGLGIQVHAVKACDPAD